MCAHFAASIVRENTVLYRLDYFPHWEKMLARQEGDAVLRHKIHKTLCKEVFWRDVPCIHFRVCGTAAHTKNV